MNSAYFLALASALSFSIASLVFTHFARKVSVLWMNAFKASAALVSFGVAVLLQGPREHSPVMNSVILFLASGLIGLNIADLFLVKAFKAIGPARTLVIFSFQPIFLGVLAYFLLGQTLSLQKGLGIFFMIACVFTLSYERFKKERKWDILGPLFALAGVALDSCGILLTRTAFEFDPHITVLEGNFYRCLGAIFGFLVISQFIKIDMLRTFFKMTYRARTVVLFGGILGTFVSLWMYLTAISRGNLATISAIIGTGPVFAGVLEAVIQRRWPSRYLYYAFGLFGCGFYLIY
jgi:drug/metabolite transporter (DMT)-like permease